MRGRSCFLLWIHLWTCCHSSTPRRALACVTDFALLYFAASCCDLIRHSHPSAHPASELETLEIRATFVAGVSNSDL